MDKMMENKVQIEKKWKKMEEEGKLHSENGTMTFTSTPSKEEQCTVDIDENIKGIE